MPELRALVSAEVSKLMGKLERRLFESVCRRKFTGLTFGDLLPCFAELADAATVVAAGPTVSAPRAVLETFLIAYKRGDGAAVARMFAPTGQPHAENCLRALAIPAKIAAASAGDMPTYNDIASRFAPNQLPGLEALAAAQNAQTPMFLHLVNGRHAAVSLRTLWYAAFSGSTDMARAALARYCAGRGQTAVTRLAAITTMAEIAVLSGNAQLLRMVLQLGVNACSITNVCKHAVAGPQRLATAVASELRRWGAHTVSANLYGLARP